MIRFVAGIVLGTLICAMASAQSLDDRVRELERRVEQLEKQVAQPTSPVSTPRPVSSQPEGWRQTVNWRSLRRGMTESDVRSILGEPNKIGVNLAFTRWDYPGGGRAEFGSRDGRLEGWSEPR
jgi:hypothetical protein